MNNMKRRAKTSGTRKYTLRRIQNDIDYWAAYLFREGHTKYYRLDKIWHNPKKGIKDFLFFLFQREYNSDNLMEGNKTNGYLYAD